MPTKVITATIPGVTSPQSKLTAPDAASQDQAVSLTRPPASKQRPSARNKATAMAAKAPQIPAREWLQPHLVPLSSTVASRCRRAVHGELAFVGARFLNSFSFA